MRIAAFFIAIASTASAASAQVIYAPLVTQYGGGNPYDYAGDSPLVHARAAYPCAEGASFGRRDGFAYVDARRIVNQRRSHAFTDYLGPHGNPLSALTAADVINAAHARMPRYFRKADLSAAAPLVASETSGDRPATGTIVIIVHRPPTTRPTNRPTNVPST